MEKIIINGGNKLFGDVYINGMKNAALPIIFATILTSNKCIIENVPKVSDITMSFDILTAMGAKIKYLNETTVKIDNLPDNADFFKYQRQVNSSVSSVASHTVIDKYIKRNGEDYRFEVKPNPEKTLRDRTADNTDLARKKGL